MAKPEGFEMTLPKELEEIINEYDGYGEYGQVKLILQAIKKRMPKKIVKDIISTSHHDIGYNSCLKEIISRLELDL